MSAVEHLDAPFSQRLSPIKPADVHESDSNVLARRLDGMGSSFFWATQLLSVPQREATYRIYAFCRELEDIADGEAASSVKHSLFAEWRNEIASLYAGEPRHALTRGVREIVRLYGLRSDDFVAVINGREMDVTSGIRAPTLPELDLYCERVAAAPARLLIRICGERTSMGERVAAKLGRALQLTIILRDLRKAADRQRLFLPRELLRANGISTSIPGWVLAHPALADVCRDLARIAEGHYAAAARAIAACPRTNTRPVAVILGIYRALLHELLARRWNDLASPVRISSWRKLSLVFRHGSTGR